MPETTPPEQSLAMYPAIDEALRAHSDMVRYAYGTYQPGERPQASDITPVAILAGKAAIHGNGDIFVIILRQPPPEGCHILTSTIIAAERPLHSAPFTPLHPNGGPWTLPDLRQLLTRVVWDGEFSTLWAELVQKSIS